VVESNVGTNNLINRDSPAIGTTSACSRAGVSRAGY